MLRTRCSLAMTGRIGLYFYSLAGAGGAERMICQLAGALAERDFEVRLISWDPGDAKSFYPIHSGVEWTKLGFVPGKLDKLRRARALYVLLRRLGIEVLAGFVMSGDKSVYAAAKLAGVKLVVAERNAPVMYRYRCNALQRWATFCLLGLADRITVQMPTYASGYPRRLRDRIVAIPNPVPVAESKARPQAADDAGRFTLLAVSRLDAVQKRVGTLVGAFARIASRFPAWDLCVIGDGPEEQELRHLVERLGLEARIRIEISMRDVFGAYARSHLFAIPSRWEGFSNALAEAMSHGLPAVGFERAAGVAELIGPEGGWLATGLDDENELATALEQAMADGAERARRGEAASRRMAEFAPHSQFDRWAALFQSLMKCEVA